MLVDGPIFMFSSVISQKFSRKFCGVNGNA